MCGRDDRDRVVQINPLQPKLLPIRSKRPGQKPLQQFYPRPGKKNVSVRLGIVPIAGGDPVWVEWDRKTHEYLASVRWDKQGPLTIQVQDRRQQEILLLRVDPTTGKTKKLLDERDPAFTNLRQDMPQWLPRGRLGTVRDDRGR